ncbi:MAG: hypothetical protein ACRDRB_23155, partial [Pseudonocardiaceae bacterium]
MRGPKMMLLAAGCAAALVFSATAQPPGGPPPGGPGGRGPGGRGPGGPPRPGLVLPPFVQESLH